MSDHLSVRGVSRIFQGARGQSTQALLPVDFEVRENDFVTILGPSGCGKSTLLRIVAGLDYPTTGQVMLDGRPVEGPGGDRGVVFQSYTLFPWLTIAQNIRFGVNSGLMIAQVTAAALASENKSLAHPASVDSLPTSANQEDHVSMATFGARRLAEMADNTAVVVGIEAMGAAQGIELKRGLRSSPLLEATFADLRSRVAFLHQDRFLAPDVEAMRRWAGRATWPDALLRLLPSHADACAAAHAATA